MKSVIEGQHTVEHIQEQSSIVSVCYIGSDTACNWMCKQSYSFEPAKEIVQAPDLRHWRWQLRGVLKSHLWPCLAN